jgi:hypothetical protein
LVIIVCLVFHFPLKNGGGFRRNADSSTRSSSPPLYKVTVITTTTFDSIFISKDTTAWKGSCGERKISFVQSLVNIIGRNVYICDDKIILCTNNAEPVFGLEPTVALGIRRTTYAIEGIGNCCISRLSFVSGSRVSYRPLSYFLIDI